jgi:hypothetical protein
MYYAKERKRNVSPETDSLIHPSAPTIGPLIATYDQSIALANEATVNFYSAPLAHKRPEEKSPDE